MLGVSRSAYYKHFRRRQSQGDLGDTVIKLVEEEREDQPRLGTRKLHKLISSQVKCGRDKLFSILRANKMLVERKKRLCRTTYSNHGYAVAPNLIKDIEVTGPDQVYVSDITYITLRNGYAYLFLVTDMYSRKIVGYHVSRDLTHHSALLALSMAISDIDPEGIIHHSDRGCQYCCHEFLNYLKSHGMKASMTDENHCYQNAIAERVNGILKNEFNCDQVFLDYKHAKHHVIRSVNTYNYKRLHWSLDLKTPEEVYSMAA